MTHRREQMASLTTVGQFISFIIMMANARPHKEHPNYKDHVAVEKEAEESLAWALATYGAVYHAGHVYMGIMPVRTGVYIRVSVLCAAKLPWPLTPPPAAGPVQPPVEKLAGRIGKEVG